MTVFYELSFEFCTGLGPATRDTFRYFLLRPFSLHVVFLPDKEAQHSFILQLGDTYNSHLCTPALSLSNAAEISPHRTPSANLLSLQVCPSEKQLISRIYLPHPDPSVATGAVQQRIICYKPKRFTAYLSKSFALMRLLQGTEDTQMCT